MSGKMFLVVALPCEAKPLVSRFRLKRVMSVVHFAMYANEDADLALIVSGIGKGAAAAAVAYCAALRDASALSVWLNVGIAGHRRAPLGTAFVAEKIRDGDSGKCWFPPLVIDHPCAGADMVSVSRPEAAYRGDAVYDMEAAAFFETALRFGSGELIQCFKVISDNAASPVSAVSPAHAESLIEARLDEISAVLERLSGLAAGLAPVPCPLLSAYSAHWRFSTQQQVQLERLLRRWQVLDVCGPPRPESLAELKHARAVLQWLEREIDALPVTLDGGGATRNRS